MDFLIHCKGKYLLIKRTQEPVKDVYWVIGGRMRFKETVKDLASRVQIREVGTFLNVGNPIGFSNYFFPDVPDSRATHTPTLLNLVKVSDIFEPVLDDTSADYIWSDKLPEELIKQTQFIVPLEQLSH